MLQYSPFVLAVTLLVAQTSGAQERGTPWPRHTINTGTRGADGVRLADANGDGRLDICTAFEEGAQVKVLLQPTRDKLKDPWPAVIVGRDKDGEDAFFADVDGDGTLDVVSCHEGKTRSVFVHWAPQDKNQRDKKQYLDAAAWKTEPFPMLRGKQMWMFGLPVEGGLVLGSKGPKSAKTNEGTIGLLQPPRENRRDLSAWTWTPWSDTGWIMSIQPLDINRDGQSDVLVSDRYGPRAGIAWYENPGKDKVVWPRHDVCKLEVQALFLTPATLEANRTDVLIASSKAILWYKLNGELRETIPLPDWCGSGKAVSAGDIDGDQQPDLVITCENAVGERSGIAWAKRGPAGWHFHDIGGPAGIKYDLCPLVDLDNDGDLDVITTEEREGPEGGLGVVWYENPTK